MTATRPLPEAVAQACLNAVRAQFAAYIPPNPGKHEQPRLFPPGHNGSGWVIQWQDPTAPHDWTLLAFVGGCNEDLAYELINAGVLREQATARAAIAAAPAPDGVHAEAINPWELGLYPA